MKKMGGMTLIELMIVMVILGVLAAIALPNYKSYVLRSHRSAAAAAVLDVASREVRYYTTNNAYTSSMTTLGYSTDPMPVPSSSQHFYDVSVALDATSGFKVTAQRYGDQQNDTCGNFIYDGLGKKDVSAGTVSDCWKQ